jgi:hypothetical protein
MVNKETLPYCEICDKEMYLWQDVIGMHNKTHKVCQKCYQRIRRVFNIC